MKEYDANNIGKLIENNDYVGRGIVIGMTETTAKAVSAYFIMGRSENSRNRIFEVVNGELHTRPHDEAKVKDPSLIIYPAIKSHENNLVVTNGDHTDTVIDYLEQGKTFEDGLATRQFEPDYPNLTPRISGMITFDNSDVADSAAFAYKMSILKSMDEEGTCCGRYFFNYEAKPGLGHFIHTYECDGNPLPSFQGEPERVLIPDSIDELTQTLWNGLDKDNRISLYVRYTSPDTGEYEERLINKNPIGKRDIKGKR